MQALLLSQLLDALAGFSKALNKAVLLRINRLIMALSSILLTNKLVKRLVIAA